MNQVVLDSTASVTRSNSQNYTPRNPIYISNDAGLAAVATSGMGTASDPYIITGWNISESLANGISIQRTTNYFRIQNCWINSASSGIEVDNVAPGTATITNNTCKNNKIGISLGASGSSTITDNILSNNNVDGIYLEYSGFSIIANNTFNNCGIYLGDSNSSIVVNNTCNGNLGYGIRLWESSHSTITNNSCYNNGNGIELDYSDFNVILLNGLRQNGGYGIEVSETSDNNSIHHNSFVQNGAQACDDGSYNQWYDEKTLEGNYWSDYSGTGSYIIAGAAGALDLYPSGDTPEPTSIGIGFNDLIFLLVRITLFLGILGVLIVSLFLNRNK